MDMARSATLVGAAAHPANRSPYPQLPVDEALALVLHAVAPLPTVALPFEQALGLVLAETVLAREPMPPFAASAKDGYAVVAADGQGTRRVLGEAVAGNASDLVVGPGKAARITTGAPLPRGADAVVMVEDTVIPSPDGVTINRAVSPGENIRRVGEDYEAAAKILAAGTLVGPAEVGLLASAGAAVVHCHRRPRVAVFSTGDELVKPASELRPGQIRDSNRFALAAAAREAGAEVVTSATIGDQHTALSALADAVTSTDAVITSGGVSMGHRDLVKPWLAEHGELIFGRVLSKPGKPVTFALVKGRPFFALPGFPVSAMVSFELFVRPALRRMAGDDSEARPRLRVRLAETIEHAADRVEFVRAVVWQDTDGVPCARTTGFQGSGRLLSLSGANALLRMEPGAGRTAAGTIVNALLIRRISGADPASTK
jgi:molybdenum cofactor synthesis domain-containing protein